MIVAAIVQARTNLINPSYFLMLIGGLNIEKVNPFYFRIS